MNLSKKEESEELTTEGEDEEIDENRFILEKKNCDAKTKSDTKTKSMNQQTKKELEIKKRRIKLMNKSEKTSENNESESENNEEEKEIEKEVKKSQVSGSEYNIKLFLDDLKNIKKFSVIDVLRSIPLKYSNYLEKVRDKKLISLKNESEKKETELKDKIKKLNEKISTLSKQNLGNEFNITSFLDDLINITNFDSINVLNGLNLNNEYLENLRKERISTLQENEKSERNKEINTLLQQKDGYEKIIKKSDLTSYYDLFLDYRDVFKDTDYESQINKAISHIEKKGREANMEEIKTIKDMRTQNLGIKQEEEKNYEIPKKIEEEKHYEKIEEEKEEKDEKKEFEDLYKINTEKLGRRRDNVNRQKKVIEKIKNEAKEEIKEIEKKYINAKIEERKKLDVEKLKIEHENQILNEKFNQLNNFGNYIKQAFYNENQILGEKYSDLKYENYQLDESKKEISDEKQILGEKYNDLKYKNYQLDESKKEISDEKQILGEKYNDLKYKNYQLDQSKNAKPEEIQLKEIEEIKKDNLKEFNEDIIKEEKQIELENEQLNIIVKERRKKEEGNKKLNNTTVDIKASKKEKAKEERDKKKINLINQKRKPDEEKEKTELFFKQNPNDFKIENLKEKLEKEEEEEKKKEKEKNTIKLIQEKKEEEKNTINLIKEKPNDFKIENLKENLQEKNQPKIMKIETDEDKNIDLFSKMYKKDINKPEDINSDLNTINIHGIDNQDIVTDSEKNKENKKFKDYEKKQPDLTGEDVINLYAVNKKNITIKEINENKYNVNKYDILEDVLKKNPEISNPEKNNPEISNKNQNRKSNVHIEILKNKSSHISRLVNAYYSMSLEGKEERWHYDMCTSQLLTDYDKTFLFDIWEFINKNVFVDNTPNKKWKKEYTEIIKSLVNSKSEILYEQFGKDKDKIETMLSSILYCKLVDPYLLQIFINGQLNKLDFEKEEFQKAKDLNTFYGFAYFIKFILILGFIDEMEKKERKEKLNFYEDIKNEILSTRIIKLLYNEKYTVDILQIFKEERIPDKYVDESIDINGVVKILEKGILKREDVILLYKFYDLKDMVANSKLIFEDEKFIGIEKLGESPQRKTTEKLYIYITSAEYLEIKDIDRMRNKLELIYINYRNQFPTYIYRDTNIKRGIEEKNPLSFPNNFTDVLNIDKDNVNLEYKQIPKNEKPKDFASVKKNYNIINEFEIPKEINYLREGVGDQLVNENKKEFFYNWTMMRNMLNELHSLEKTKDNEKFMSSAFKLDYTSFKDLMKSIRKYFDELLVSSTNTTIKRRYLKFFSYFNTLNFSDLFITLISNLNSSVAKDLGIFLKKNPILMYLNISPIMMIDGYRIDTLYKIFVEIYAHYIEKDYSIFFYIKVMIAICYIFNYKEDIRNDSEIKLLNHSTYEKISYILMVVEYSKMLYYCNEHSVNLEQDKSKDLEHIKDYLSILKHILKEKSKYQEFNENQDNFKNYFNRIPIKDIIFLNVLDFNWFPCVFYDHLLTTYPEFSNYLEKRFVIGSNDQIFVNDIKKNFYRKINENSAQLSFKGDGVFYVARPIIKELYEKINAFNEIYRYVSSILQKYLKSIKNKKIIRIDEDEKSIVEKIFTIYDDKIENLDEKIDKFKEKFKENSKELISKNTFISYFKNLFKKEDKITLKTIVNNNNSVIKKALTRILKGIQVSIKQSEIINEREHLLFIKNEFDTQHKILSKKGLEEVIDKVMKSSVMRLKYISKHILTLSDNLNKVMKTSSFYNGLTINLDLEKIGENAAFIYTLFQLIVPSITTSFKIKEEDKKDEEEVNPLCLKIDSNKAQEFKKVESKLTSKRIITNIEYHNKEKLKIIRNMNLSDIRCSVSDLIQYY